MSMTPGSAAVHAAYVEVPEHRADYNLLLATNPNYFGNVPASGIDPVVTIVDDTTFERLTCVSYNPQRTSLEATFELNRSFGYGGGLCAAGSREYVRFWMDYGGGWIDAGLVGVNVYDLPIEVDCAGAATFPVSHIATLTVSPESAYCFTPVLPKVRAILSWNTPPPGAPTAAVPDPADWQPAYGNVLDATVQIAPRPLLLLDVLSVLDVTLATLPGPMQAVAGIPIPEPVPDPLGVAQLAALYRSDAKPESADGAAVQSKSAFSVPAARFGTSEIVPALSNAQPLAVEQAIKTWAALGLDWAGAVATLAASAGDTEYEQLDCVGLDVARGFLTGTITIKRPTGYSGGLCTAGSAEYVAFWGDFGDSDCALTYLGTAAVGVHDISAIPVGGLEYAAVLPVDLSAHLKPCEQPVIARIRAVLSWGTPPSTTDPYVQPYWGNAIDAHVQLPPRRPGPGPHVWAIGGIGVADLDSSNDATFQTTSGSGLTLPDAHFALSNVPTDARPCPFGGRVVVQGTPVLGGSYRVQVRDLTAGGGWSSLVGPVAVVDGNGVESSHYPNGDYYPYLGYLANVDSALVDWNTTGNGLWELKLDARDAAQNPLGEVRYRVRIDSTAPTVDIHISDGGDCKTFPAGSTIHGSFVAVDASGYFGGYSLGILPANLPGGTGVLSPSSGTTPTALAPGDAWQLATGSATDKMNACAYVATVQAHSRTIIDSADPDGWSSDVAAIGFSLQ